MRTVFKEYSAIKKGCAASRNPGVLERVMGIEPTLSAWEAEVLPLNYTRNTIFFILRPAENQAGRAESLTLKCAPCKLGIPGKGHTTNSIIQGCEKPQYLRRYQGRALASRAFSHGPSKSG
jgi:hypothetical protein